MRWGYTARRLLASVRADREKHVAESEQVAQELQKEREGRARDREGHEGERRAWMRDKDDLLERCKAASMNWERERQVWKVATQDWEKEKHELTQMREEKEQALQAERAMRGKDREEWQAERVAYEREQEESRRERDEAIKAWAWPLMDPPGPWGAPLSTISAPSGPLRATLMRAQRGPRRPSP